MENNQSKGLDSVKRLSTKSSQCELEKRPAMAEHAHGFVVSTCNIARRAAHDCTLFK